MKVPAFIARAIEAQGKTTVEEVERRLELERRREEASQHWNEPKDTQEPLVEIPGRESSGIKRRHRGTSSSGDA